MVKSNQEKNDIIKRLEDENQRLYKLQSGRLKQLDNFQKGTMGSSYGPNTKNETKTN